MVEVRVRVDIFDYKPAKWWINHSFSGVSAVLDKRLNVQQTEQDAILSNFVILVDNLLILVRPIDNGLSKCQN